MLTLYVKSGCPYCAKVLIEAAMLNVEFDERNIAEPGVAEELVAKGGKLQTPFLIDHDRNKQIYESDAIVDYLHETFTEAPVE